MSGSNGSRRAIFLDRDGVLCENRADYVKSREELVMIPGAARAVAAINAAGVPVFVVTNQSAVGRGIVAPGALDDVHAALRGALESEGAHVEQILVCPHAPAEGCACRKPEPGLLLEAARRHGLDLRGSWMVGDAATDVAAAAAAGCGSVLVLTGRGRSQSRDAQPDIVARDLTEAARLILDRIGAQDPARR